MRICEVVSLVEGQTSKDDTHYFIGFPRSYGSPTAATHLVARLFTDAIFSYDVRSMQTIINRIDGGLPKDTEIGDYQTYFSDCVNELLSYSDADKLKLKPDDSVMMAMTKAIYDIATEDIYWDYEHQRKKKPSDTKKQQRDNAMRLILERAGGRKTLQPVAEVVEEIDLAPWLKGFLNSSNEG